MSLVPFRPDALAVPNADNFEGRLSVLKVVQDKAGKDRRITLPKQTADFFAGEAARNPKGAPLLARADGARWNKDSWKKPVKAAAAAAELPSNTTAYALRHSVITDSVSGGLDLLTVAQLRGTSVAMIEKHYGHLQGNHSAAALASLAL